MKYFLIVAVLIISGCQQPANSLSNFSIDNTLMGVNAPVKPLDCKEKTLNLYGQE